MANFVFLTFAAAVVVIITGTKGDPGCELVGQGACRGPEWSEDDWPKTVGLKSKEECCRICEKEEEDCTGFHLTKGGGECILFGHSQLIPAKALGGECYKINKDSNGGKLLSPEQCQRLVAEQCTKQLLKGEEEKEKKKESKKPGKEDKKVKKAEKEDQKSQKDEPKDKKDKKKEEQVKEKVKQGEKTKEKKDENAKDDKVKGSKEKKEEKPKKEEKTKEPKKQETPKAKEPKKQEAPKEPKKQETPKTKEQPKKTPKAKEPKKQEPEKVDGKYVHKVGEGGCRGTGWAFGDWPKLLGHLGFEDCAKKCIKSEDCTAIHLLDKDDHEVECLHFGHSQITAVLRLGGNCYTFSDEPPQREQDEEDEDEDDLDIKGPVKITKLGHGMCRGDKWQADRKWPKVRGAMNLESCGMECAKKRGCTAFDLSEGEDDQTICVLYGHKKVVPASAVPGDCYTLTDRLTDDMDADDDDDDDDEDEDVKHTGPDVSYSHLGKGRCRGEKWQSRKWPVLRSRRSLQDCANACGSKDGCTAFDVSEEENGIFDCVLYGHKDPAPASAVPGDCYDIAGDTFDPEDFIEEEILQLYPDFDEDEEEEIEELSDENIEYLGKGACRGENWQDHRKWPKVIKGRLSLEKCAEACKEQKGCTAFDVSRKKDDKYDCLLFGHPDVVPASAVKGKCFAIVGARPSDEDDEETPVQGDDDDFVALGKGSCRGPNWADKLWPKEMGVVKSVEECYEICSEEEGCTAFDITEDVKCTLFAHSEVIPASALEGTCYKIREEVEEEDARLLGPGACRGEGWTFKGWPKEMKSKDKITVEACEDECASTRGCTAFDIREDDNEFVCTMYGHKKVAPASAVPANCYKASSKHHYREEEVKEEEPEDEGDLKLLGTGACRGEGWQSYTWPKVIRAKRMTLEDCADDCGITKGCQAIDFHEEDNEPVCVMFGHKNIVPASGVPGTCYLVPKGREPSKKSQEDREELLSRMTSLGKGACRGSGWTSANWPKEIKLKKKMDVEDCAEHCDETKGCTAFDIRTVDDHQLLCTLYGHNNIQPATGVPGSCYSFTPTEKEEKTPGKKEEKQKKEVKKQEQKKKVENKPKKYKIPEFKPPKVLEDEDDPNEDDWLFEPPPREVRSRDHITQILGLESSTDKNIEKITETTLRELKKVYENSVKPLETTYAYKQLSNRHFGDPEIFSKPLIVLMGPWSGGKSTMMNYLLGNEYNKNAFPTGAEPSPGFNFNIAMYGDKEQNMEGTELAAEFAFSSLQKFGLEFLKKLRGKKIPNKLLAKATLAEIPGVLETGSIRKRDRLYPFNDACQWFIDHADLILLVYDYSKLDIGPETEALLDQLKGRESQVRILLNKADEITAEELLKIQSSLVWNVSPLMASMEPPTLYAGSFWSRPYKEGAPKKLLKAQENALLRDINEAINKRVENRIATARRFSVRVRNHAKMVDCYLTTFHNIMGYFGDKNKIAADIINNPNKYHIYEGLSTMTNISRYDLPDPETYRDFFNLHPLYEFPTLKSTCTFFRGCPINKLDMAIAYDFPELLAGFKKKIQALHYSK